MARLRASLLCGRRQYPSGGRTSLTHKSVKLELSHLDSGDILKIERLDGIFAQLEFLDLTRHGHRVFGNERDMTGDFVVCDLPLAMDFNVLFSQRCSFAPLDGR